MAHDIIGGDVAADWTRRNHFSCGTVERIAVTKQTLARFASGAKGCLVGLEAAGGYQPLRPGR